MDEDARESAMHFDAQETDPAKQELFRQLYHIDALVRDSRARLPDATYQAIEDAIIRALEQVRMLPAR